MSPRAAAAVLLLLVSAAFRARAQEARPAPAIEVGDPWNDQTRMREYNWKEPPSLVTKFTNGVLMDSPFPVAPIAGPLFDPFAGADARAIAQRCKSAYPDAWSRIGCVSHGVHDFFIGFKFDGLRSYCRSHAQAFQEVFSLLNIPRSLAKPVDASGPLGDPHVANAVIVTGATGQTYAYVIDSGWFPGKLFPQNDAAIRWHDRDGDGKTEVFDLPPIGTEPVYGFRPAPARP